MTFPQNLKVFSGARKNVQKQFEQIAEKKNSLKLAFEGTIFRI